MTEQMTEVVERLRKAAARAELMLLVAKQYFSEHPECAEETIVYDAAECDGGCIGEDCQDAAHELGNALALLQAIDYEGLVAERSRLSDENIRLLTLLQTFCVRNPDKGTTFKQWVREMSRQALAHKTGGE